MSKELTQLYSDQGYIIIKSSKRRATHRILEEIKEMFSNSMGERFSDQSLIEWFSKYPNTVKNTGKCIQNLISTYKLMIDDDITDTLKLLGLKSPIVTTRPVTFFHHPKLAEQEVYFKTPQHQDYPSMQSSGHSIVLWMPLVDCVDDEIGPLEIVPSSHKEGILTEWVENNFAVTTKYNDEDFKKVYMNAGDMLFFNSLLVHRSGDNTSDRIRFSVNFRYGDYSATDWINRGYQNPYTYRPVFDMHSVLELKEYFSKWMPISF